MPGYRLYFLDEMGRVRRRQDLECTDDKEAVAVARAMKHPYGKELWSGTRPVETFNASDD
jgi:hypothetical protein